MKLTKSATAKVKFSKHKNALCSDSIVTTEAKINKFRWWNSVINVHKPLFHLQIFSVSAVTLTSHFFPYSRLMQIRRKRKRFSPELASLWRRQDSRLGWVTEVSSRRILYSSVFEVLTELVRNTRSCYAIGKSFKILKQIVRHVTGNDKDYLSKMSASIAKCRRLKMSASIAKCRRSRNILSSKANVPT